MLGARRPQASQSKASTTTLCQKCLKRDIYECTVAASERPYNARPSRSQQLANPKLRPKLTNEAPGADLLRKEGVADATLARREAERRAAGRSRSASPVRRAAASAVRRASRSPASSYSSRSRSASTISTNLSRSPSPAQRMRGVTYPSHRNYRSTRDVPYPSQQDSQPFADIGDYPVAPASSGSRKRRRGSSSGRSEEASLRSQSASSSDSGRERRHRRQEKDGPGERNIRRRRNSVSPDARGRRHDHPQESDGHRRRRSGSRDRGDIARHRQSMTPEVESRVRGVHPQRLLEGRVDGAPGPRSRDARDGGETRGRRNTREAPREKESLQAAAQPPRERSLSPYSKRVAMARAMNLGR